MVAFVGINNDMFIPVFTTARHCTWPRDTKFQSESEDPSYRRSISILSSGLHLGARGGLIFSWFPSKIVYLSSFSFRKQSYYAPRFLHHDKWYGTNHEAPQFALFSSLLSLLFISVCLFSAIQLLKHSQTCSGYTASWAELTLRTPLIHLRYVRIYV